MKKLLLVFGVVAGVAAGVFLGASLAKLWGWKAPAWLAFLPGGGDGGAGGGLFCEEHGVPEAYCTLCHEELKGKLEWCAEHGLPEAICTACHPDAERRLSLKGICKEHGLPRSFCVSCNPSLAAGQVESDWCLAHSLPRSLCVRCTPELAKTIPLCKQHGNPAAVCPLCDPRLAKAAPGKAAGGDGGASLPLVRLAGPEVARRAGLEASPVEEGPVPRLVTGYGEVEFDESRFAAARPLAGGIIREVLVREGDVVEQGQDLAVIDSAALGEAKAEYLGALADVELWAKAAERARSLRSSGVSAEKDILETEASLRRAEVQKEKASQRLRGLGLDDEGMARLQSEDPAARGRLTVKAPLAGTVVRRRAVAGEAVDSLAEVFAVADLARMWVRLDVAAADLRLLEPGQPFKFRVSTLGEKEFHGRILWIDAEVNEKSRTLRLRAEVENEGRVLRAHMFGTGEVLVGEPKTSLLVPGDALQWEGSSYVVFVEQAPDRYEPRRVVPGRRSGARVELAWGQLHPGERVVTTGSFLLKTEIQKGSIGAGCCGE